MIFTLQKAISKRIFLIFFYYLLIVLSLNAQDIHIKVDGLLANEVFLQAYHGSDLRTVDTTNVLDEKIYFENKNYPEGLYRIILGNSEDAALFKMEVSAFDFIISNEDISLQTSYFNTVQSMKVIQSDDNVLFFDYQQYNASYRTKLGSLLSLLSDYSDQDQFYPDLRREIIRLQKEYNNKLISMTSDTSHDFIFAYLTFMLEPVYDPDLGISIKDFMKDNFLDPVDFISPALIHSPAISQKILAYLSFYGNREFSQAEQEDEFIKAVDLIMNEVIFDQEVHDFVLNFLIEGFEKFQMEKVLVHIADNHLSGECETDNEKILQERLIAYQEMSVGKLVKNIHLLNEKDEAVSLSDIQNEYTLIIFWATWCPHCNKLISNLSDWYKNEAEQYDIEVFAVSIDTSKADWEEIVYINDLNWINTIEPKGWEGKVSRQYNIYATPTMFLINRKREIIAKPLTMREFQKVLKDLF